VSKSRIAGERAYPGKETDPPLAYTPSLEARFMFTRKPGSAQGDSPCKQCRGTGLLLVGRFLIKEATVACSCSTGNALWSRLLKIAKQAEDQERKE
jgi:hypothetical protein